MKKDIKEIIEIPEGVSFTYVDGILSLKSGEKEIKRKFIENDKIQVKLNEGNKIEISSKKATKKELKILNTLVAHLRNMVKGIQEEFIYELEICNVHFPMTVKVEGDKFFIKNFLGERKDRVSKIVGGANVEAKGQKITVKSPDIEAAGQTAANMEKATRVGNRDRRVFQDGIFITSKPNWSKK